MLLSKIICYSKLLLEIIRYSMLLLKIIRYSMLLLKIIRYSMLLLKIIRYSMLLLKIIRYSMLLFTVYSKFTRGDRSATSTTRIKNRQMLGTRVYTILNQLLVLMASGIKLDRGRRRSNIIFTIILHCN
jgi:hypothetical protein